MKRRKAKGYFVYVVVILLITVSLGALAMRMDILDKLQNFWESNENRYITYEGIIISDYETHMTLPSDIGITFGVSDKFCENGYNVEVILCEGDVYKDFRISDNSGRTTATFRQKIGQDITDKFSIEKSEKEFTIKAPNDTPILKSCFAEFGNVPSNIISSRDYNFALIITSGDGETKYVIRLNQDKFSTDKVEVKGGESLKWLIK